MDGKVKVIGEKWTVASLLHRIDDQEDWHSIVANIMVDTALS